MTGVAMGVVEVEVVGTAITVAAAVAVGFTKSGTETSGIIRVCAFLGTTTTEAVDVGVAVFMACAVAVAIGVLVETIAVAVAIGVLVETIVPLPAIVSTPAEMVVLSRTSV
jgi:hypothetical protein